MGFVGWFTKSSQGLTALDRETVCNHLKFRDAAQTSLGGPVTEASELVLDEPGKNSQGTVPVTRAKGAQATHVPRIVFLDLFSPQGAVLSSMCIHGCVYLMEYKWVTF